MTTAPFAAIHGAANRAAAEHSREARSLSDRSLAFLADLDSLLEAPGTVDRRGVVAGSGLAEERGAA